MGLNGTRQGRIAEARVDWRRGRELSRALRSGTTANFCGLLILGGALVSGLVAPAWADAPPIAPERVVSLDVVAADIHTVVHMLQAQTGLNFVIQDPAPGDRQFGLVTVGLRHASLDMVLRNIAYSADARVTRDADGTYVISPVASDAWNAANVQDSAAPSPPPQYAAQTETQENYFWHKIVLQYAVPSDILRKMRWDKDDVDVNPFRHVQAPDTSLRATNNGGITVVAPNTTVGNSSDYSQQPSVPIGHDNTGGTSANYSVDQAHRSVDPASPDQAHQFGGFGGGFGGGGQGGFGGNQGGGRGGFGGNQVGGVGGGANGQGGGYPTGVDRVYALEADNSLLVFATPEGYQAVKQIVSYLDIAPRQVQIKVEFITANVSEVDSFGINFTSFIPYPGVAINSNLATAQGLSAGSLGVAIAHGNLIANLLLNDSRTHAKVVQAPLITTTNNVPATIQVTQEIPYTTTTTIVGGTGVPVSNTQQQFLQVPTGLTVSPRINSDDTVTLLLQPQISTVGSTPSNGGPPAVTTQYIQTVRTVRSGDTMVLGGLVAKNESNNTQRIPFLADLPVIGNLFRTRNKTISDSELLIFVTPLIIGDNQDTPPVSVGTGQVAP